MSCQMLGIATLALMEIRSSVKSKQHEIVKKVFRGLWGNMAGGLAARLS